MGRSIFFRWDASVICLVLLLFMLMAIVIGHRMRKVFWNAKEEDARGGVNALLGALFGLWGFILAFTFGQSGSRFENVRSVMVDEANMLRNAILKTDFFPDSVRAVYRSELGIYLEERISYYEYASDDAKFARNREELSKTASALWSTTVALSKKPGFIGPVADMGNLLTSLFDIGIKREAMLNSGVPTPISLLLITLALAICLIGGFTTPSIHSKEWIVIAVFALMASTILYITIDLARPMQGLIKPDTGQKTLVDLRKLF